MPVIEDERSALRILGEAGRVAVLGMKPESHASAPAFYVPSYLQRVGYEVVPVPVYFPDVTTMLGERVYRRLADVPGPVDLVLVFRRPADIPAHVEDILALGPRAVWFQLGIRNDAVAKQLSEAGIDVVQDRCAMIDHRRI
jgi:uncharacterized protein